MSEQKLIPKTPSGWAKVFVDEVALDENSAIRMGPFGSHLKKHELVNSGIRVLWIENVVNNQFEYKIGKFITKEKFQQLSGFRVKPNDILVTMMGTIGRTCIIPNDIGTAIISSHLLKISLDPRLCNSKFLELTLRGNPFVIKQMEKTHRGSVMKGLNTKIIKNLFFLLPPLNEQKRIVSKIEELFSKIDSTKQLLEHTKLQLEQYRHSLPKSLFEGGHNEKWEKTKLGQVSKLYVPQRDKPKKFDGNIPWLRIEDLDGKYAIDSKSNQRVSQKTVDKMNLRIYPIGTVLCSCSATLGVCAITKKPLITNQTFIGIFPNSMLNNEFLYYYMLTQTNNLTNVGKGGTIKYISRKKFEELQIKIPPLEDQKQIISQIEYGFSLIENTSQIVNSTLQQLETMKISILKQAFEGKLVPQDPNDEPASILLERIKKEKIKT